MAFRAFLIRAGGGLLAWFAVAPLLHAQGYEETKERAGDVVLKLHLDRVTLPLSGHLHLTVNIEGPAPLEVEAIREMVASREWEESPVADPELSKLSNNRMRWRQTFRLEPLQKGKLELPINDVYFRAGPKPDKGNWEWVRQAWKPMNVEVTSAVSVASLDEIKDITPIVTWPEEPRAETWKWAAAGGGATVMGLGVAVWLRRRKRSRPVVELPPHQWALREFERMEALDLAGSREVERFHTLLSDVLRRYIELRFGLRAPEQTTPEFLEGLRRSSALPAAQQEQLRDFLQRCDLAKFARADYSVRECQAAAAMARTFVEQTVPQPKSGAERNGELVTHP
ncbi:MAG: hypothetical protein K2R98_07025 [Gemmataceae bacterium]|nr:hypothetical protein [Gemmataceae bacterium]